jgi:tRNA G18 (ribose-2'-O)-methylase SpoU
MTDRELYVIAHNIRSLHNIGSIFRTSDGAGVSKIFLTGYSGVPPRKEISKTALGADEFVDWEYHKDPLPLIKQLKADGVQIAALEKHGQSTSIHRFIPDERVCMIVGNEIEGVDESMLNLSDHVLHIPMYGKKQSLNVSVAFGIGIYSLTENQSRDK